MAVTITHVKNNVAGGFFEHVVDILGPASYTTGGEVLTAGQVNQLMPRLGSTLATSDLARVQTFSSERTPAGVSVALDRANAKLMYIAGGAEAGSGTAQNVVPVRAVIRYGNVGD